MLPERTAKIDTCALRDSVRYCASLTMTIMPVEDIMAAAVIAWALICIVIAVTLTTSVSSWALLVGSAVLPPLLMLRMWPLARTVPARIRAARR
jgi:hypothetical protein